MSKLENTNVLIFLKGGFRFEGKVLKVNKNFIEIFDFKSNKNKLIAVDTIAEVSYDD